MGEVGQHISPGGKVGYEPPVPPHQAQEGTRVSSGQPDGR